MLPKGARLSKNDISFVLKKPTAKLFSPHLTLVMNTKETTQTVVSFGIAFNKKLFVNSVDMHRKRRVLYARIREAKTFLALSDIPTQLFIVILPKASFFELKPTQQISELSELFKKVRY